MKAQSSAAVVAGRGPLPLSEAFINSSDRFGGARRRPSARAGMGFIPLTNSAQQIRHDAGSGSARTGNGSEPPPNKDIEHQIGQLSRELQDITALYNIGVAVGGSLSLQEVAWKLYKASGQLIDTTNFALVIYNDQTDTLDFKVVFCHGEQIEPFSIKHTDNQGLTSRVINMRAVLRIEDMDTHRNVFELEQAYPHASVRSWLGMPILDPVVRSQSAQGAIMTWSDTPDSFTNHDLWLLSAIATQASIALRNARLFEASQRRALEMAVINDVARTLSSTLNLEEVLTRIMDQVEGMLEVEAGFLLLAEPGTGDLIFQIAFGTYANMVEPFRIPKGQGVAGWVAQSGKPKLICEVEQAVDFRARNLLCVPLVIHDKVAGVLEVINKTTGPFTQQDLNLLNSIAFFAAIAIKNARMHQSVLLERDRVLDAEEKARKDLARDLHDGPTQLVAGMVMQLDFCQTALEKDPALAAKEIAQIKAMGEKAAHQMRTTLFELRPLILETAGLEAGLQTFLERRQQDIGVEPSPRLSLQIEADFAAGHISRQDPEVEAGIFAIVQETVINALKHARANQIIVRLRETNSGLYVKISDDGLGFEVPEVMKNYGQQGSLGLVNIRERTELIGGELAIESDPGLGTRINIYIPKAKADRIRKRRHTGRLSLPA